MTPERWQQVKAICYSVLDSDPGQRAAVLDAFCSRDDELRRDVVRMLEDVSDASDELERPAWELLGIVANDPVAADSSVRVAWVPEAIGRYQILRVVGEGGMGVVYQARQDEPRRDVALKVIRPGLANADLLRRFRQESHALGRLQHSGIAQIYDAGTAESPFGPQPYFAMEFVHGEPLTAFAARCHLSVPQRLELMIRICEAVNHAHQRGLIHRDLKPGNILVTEDGQPKILDFGVARLTDSDVQRTQHTSVGELVGTLAYMSPEQVAGDPDALDIRSDVYALGVILYELLTGRLPYELGAQVHEAARTIQHQDPTRLSVISRSFRGDLETIAAKALEKDKERRYGSASALAADIGRFLHDEPIVARPASASYQVRKFARRHRALVAGVAAVFVVLVAGIVATTREAIRARRAEQTAQAVSDFLRQDLLAQASATTQADTAGSPDPNLTVRTALERAAARIGARFEDQPLVEAAVRYTIGNAYADLSLYRESEPHLRRAVELRRRALGQEHPDALEIEHRLAFVVSEQGRFQEANATYTRLLDLRRRSRGDDDPITLHTLNDLGSLLYQEGKYADAEKLLLAVLAGRQRVLGEDHLDTVETMTNVANIYQNQRRFELAAPLATRALEIRRRVAGPNHPETLRALHNLGTMYGRAEQYAAGEPLLLEALVVRRQTLGPEHRDTLATMNNLATLYRLQGEFPKAEALLTEVLDIQRRVLGPEQPDTVGTMRNLAELHRMQGRAADAERLFRQVVDIRRRVFAPDNVLTADTRRSLGKLLLERGHAAGAEAELRLALTAYEKNDPENWQRYHVAGLLGESLAAQGKLAAAEPLLTDGYRGMLDRYASIPTVYKPDVPHAGRRIVEMFEAAGKPAQAAEWRQRVAAAPAPPPR